MLLYRLWPNLLDPINRLSLRGHDHPAKFFLIMLAVTAALYIPRRVYWGAGNWFEFGRYADWYSADQAARNLYLNFGYPTRILYRAY